MRKINWNRFYVILYGGAALVNLILGLTPPYYWWFNGSFTDYLLYTNNNLHWPFWYFLFFALWFGFWAYQSWQRVLDSRREK